MRRARFPWRVALGLVAAATLLPAASPGRAVADSPTLAGFSGSAAASGLHALYNPEGLLPVAAPVDFGVPDALATITTGPATFARASVADPGDLLENPDALIALGYAGWKPGTLPPYPYRVDANSGSNTPRAESSPGPGLDARVDAEGGGSKASATTPAAGAPPVGAVGSMSSLATTAISADGSTVTTHAVSKVSHFDLLGVLTIDSVVTDLTSTSTGGPAKLTGGTSLSGAAVMGQPVTIDATGIHPKKSSPLSGAQGVNAVVAALTGSVNGTLDDAVAKAGIRVTLLGPVKVAGGDTGQLGSDGLRIDLEFSQHTFPALKTLLDALPPLHNPVPGQPGPEDVIKVLEARHLVALEVGRGLVSLQAASAPGDAGPGSPATGEQVAGGSAPAVLGLGESSAPSTEGTVPGTGVANLAATPTPAGTTRPTAASFATGIGAVALLVLLAQPLLGDRLARMAHAMLAADDGDACPMKER